jgi:hypothetical protein
MLLDRQQDGLRVLVSSWLSELNYTDKISTIRMKLWLITLRL